MPLGDHGLYWPTENILLVADLHLGKEATFQRHGLAVPGGITQKTLLRVSRMLASTTANHLLILGDLFHARSSLADSVIQAFEEFLASHKQVRMTLVRGNHDIHWRDWPTRWNLHIVSPPLTINQIALAHYPGDPPAPAKMVICGHLHPAIRLPASSDLPGTHGCFWYQHRGCLVLPAVGAFTGTAKIQVDPLDKLWLPLAGQVLAIPPSSLVVGNRALNSRPGRGRR